MEVVVKPVCSHFISSIIPFVTQMALKFYYYY